MINRTLGNRYTIMEHIGGGGMADVYRAHDKLLDRSVAVKVLRSQFTNDEEFITRFRREAQAAARLSHPNIVNIYDVGRDGETDYIVMEYISGETLKERIQREKSLSVEASVRIALEIAEALEHAHQNNLIHCDIKPHNILITHTGRVKVTDFGIARAVTSGTMTHTGTVLGSVHYFSPEQARGAAIGAKSDIYSLGVVLYEMLTGSLPFTGETPIGVALKHLQETPKPPREIKPDIPPLVEAVVLKAMNKDLAGRFDNISDMIADLKTAQNYLRDESTRSLSRDDFPTQVLPRIDDGMSDPSALQPAADNPLKNRKRSRRRWIWGIVLLLMLGFLLGAFMAFGKFWSTSEVTVPDVVGKPVEAARTILTGQNLRVSVSEVFNDTVPVGSVVSQYPEAGAVVKEQRTVTLVVSKGGEVTVVPDLRGLSRRDAELQLKNAGLVLGRVDEQYDANAPVGTVISQNPRPPAQINKNTAVDIVISKGVQRKVSLPDFRGTPLSTIQTQLDSLKLKLGRVTEEANDKYPQGIIIAQAPPPGSDVAEGASVDFTVSKGSSSAPKRALVQVTVPEGQSRQAVQIVATDANGRKVIYEKVHKPGDKIERQVEGVGQLRIQVYINGTLLQEQTL
jgi:serine/threonine protein kinase/beta-lactam-binding protein with PASTA domain